MNYLIKRIVGHKISLIWASVMGVISIIFVPFGFISLSIDGVSRGFSGLFLLFPFIYFGLTYIFTRVFCGLFNVIAKSLNGVKIQLELIDVEES